MLLELAVSVLCGAVAVQHVGLMQQKKRISEQEEDITKLQAAHNKLIEAVKNELIAFEENVTKKREAEYRMLWSHTNSFMASQNERVNTLWEESGRENHG